MSDNWAYANGTLPDQVSKSGILLIPTEFGDFLVKFDGRDLQNMFQNLSVYSFMLADTNYPFRNVPLEVYAQHRFNASEESMSNRIITTIDGENALKFYGTLPDNSTVRDRWVGYYVIHNGLPYMFEYSATVKDFEKYLPPFVEMVKTLKFAK